MAAPHLYSGYIKNKTHGSESILVTIYYIWWKCYLNIYKIVADGMRSGGWLAVAIDIYLAYSKKNINEYFYSFFSTLTTISSFSAKIVQHIVSLTDNFNALTISVGIVVLKDFECFDCKFAVDSTSNNFIPPFMYLIVNIYVNILYIGYQYKV